MTAKEMFEIKYREKMATITEREWKRARENAEYKKMHIAKYIMLCLEITENDIKQNGGWYSELHNDLLELNKQKLVASNKHRQEHGHIDRYWLTEKGYKKLFA